MKSKIQLIILGIFLSTSVFAWNDPELEKFKGLADMLGVDVQTLQFKDEANNIITVKEFNLLVDNKRSFNINKVSSGTYLVINPIESDELETIEKEIADQRDNELTSQLKEFLAFSLPSTTGKQFTLDSLKGKPTLLSFYYATCLPCIHEVPHLNQLKVNLQNKINFVAVTYENLETAINFSEKYGFEWVSIIEAEKLIKEIGLPAYPAFILLDENGKTINVRVGNMAQNGVELITAWIEESGVPI